MRVAQPRTTPSSDRPDEPPAPDASEPRPASLRLLQQCTARLQRAHRDGPGAADPDTCPSVDVCLSDPTVRAACLAQAQAPPLTDDAQDSDGTAPAEGPAADGPSFAHRFATSVVGVDDQEAQWMERYLCTVHRLRQQMVGELQTLLAQGADPQKIEAAIADARLQRQAVLGDLQEQLGDARYDRLRAVGGLGVMGAALDCEDTP